MQFRIIELLVVITISGFAIASIMASTPIMESIFVNFTYAVILLALVFAIGKLGRKRAFWSGFFSIAFLYSMFSLLPGADGYSPRMTGTEATTKILNYSFKVIHGRHSDNPFASGGVFCIQEQGNVAQSEQGEFESLIELIKETIEPDSWADTSGTGTITPFSVNLSGPVIMNDDLEFHFMAIGHSIWALLLGLIGGYGSQFVYVYSRKSESSSTG